MTTPANHVGPRVDSPVEIDTLGGSRRYFQRTHYIESGLYVHTWWATGHYRGEYVPFAITIITKGLVALPAALYRKQYNAKRITVGGLAEAHEAICERVEKGELP